MATGVELLESLPVAVYVTDAEGRITYFNSAAAELWGVSPRLGEDQWCGSWRLYWADGRAMAHHECPMAVALKEGRPVRGEEAVLERPDGSRIPFAPFPHPPQGSFRTHHRRDQFAHGHERAPACRYRGSAPRGDRRIIGRCDREQNPQRRNQELEQRRRPDLRLFGGGNGRAAYLENHSAGVATGRGGHSVEAQPGTTDRPLRDRSGREVRAARARLSHGLPLARQARQYRRGLEGRAGHHAAQEHRALAAPAVRGAQSSGEEHLGHGSGDRQPIAGSRQEPRDIRFRTSAGAFMPWQVLILCSPKAPGREQTSRTLSAIR